jgi:enoyl-CoA hydratase
LSGARIERQGPLAVLRLDKVRGNAIDEDLVATLRTLALELDADEGVRGVLLASAHPKLFCPGLDLVGLIEYDRPALERFMASFSEMLLALCALRAPLVAALSGAAVAGGCVLALAADHRVLRRGAPIGLNEVKIGLPLPWSVALLLKASVAPPALTRAALFGANFTDDEAVAAGLAHEIREAEGFETACLERLSELADKEPAAFRFTKAYLRDGLLREMRAHDAARRGDFLDAWFSPPGRQRLRALVDALQKKA